LSSYNVHGSHGFYKARDFEVRLSQSSLAILQVYGKGLTRITQIGRISRKHRKIRAIRFIRAVRVKDFRTLRKP